MDENQKEAQRILDRVDRDSETLLGSSMARASNQTREHMLARDKDQNDKIEVYGTRIARVLSVIFFVYLAWSLIAYLAR